MDNLKGFNFSYFDESKNNNFQQKVPCIVGQTSTNSLETLCNKMSTNRKEFKNLLAQTGALLLRDLPVTNSNEKKIVLKSLGLKLESEYMFGISPRSKLEKEVFKSTVVPPPFPLAAHTEMAYLPFRPGVIAFHCTIEPQIYGETPLFDMRAVFNQLSENTKSILFKYKLKYKHCYPKERKFLNQSIGLTWPQIFHTVDKNKVSDKLQKYGFKYSWGKNDLLKYETIVPSIIKHPVTNQECLNILLIHPYVTKAAFNSIKSRQMVVAHYFFRWSTLIWSSLTTPATSVFLEDNSPIPYDVIKEICDLSWQNSYIFPWQKK